MNRPTADVYGITILQPNCAVRLVPPTLRERINSWMFRRFSDVVDVYLLALALICLAIVLGLVR